MSASHDQQPTRAQPATAPPPPAPAGAAPPLDVKTLVITAAASALAAYICSKVWAPGTLASAAFTPVAVALFREALHKPTEVVTSALPAALPLGRRGGSAAGAFGAPPVPPMGDDPTRVRPARPLSDTDATQVHRVVPSGEEPTRVSRPAAEPVEVHAVARPSRRRWQVALITGLLGFVIAALLITVPEVIAGKDNTTIFQGGRSTPTKTEAAPATTTTTDQGTETTPTETVTTTIEAQPTTTTRTETVTTEAAPTTTTTTPTETTPTATTPTATPEGSTDPGAVGP